MYHASQLSATLYWTDLWQHNVELSDTATQEVMFSHLLYNLHMQVQRKDNDKLVLWQRCSARTVELALVTLAKGSSTHIS
jgi:hypothetical protein